MTLVLKTPERLVWSKDYPLYDATANFEEGEWGLVDVDASGLECIKKVAATPANYALCVPSSMYTNTRSDVPFVDKANFILGHHEAYTDMYKSNDQFTVQAGLTVDAYTISGVVRGVLALAGSGDPIYAICLEPPSAANGNLLKYSTFVFPEYQS